MKILIWDDLTASEQELLLTRYMVDDNANIVENTVTAILDEVRTQGDQALFYYAKHFDQAQLDSLRVSEDEYAKADELPNEVKAAILTAADNITYYHEINLPKAFKFERNGATLGRIYRPIEKVGLYVPGGSAPLVSTVLMLGIPAKIAGCHTKILVTPPTRNGIINPAILFAAQVCGINTIYKIGGAGAIAALAFGTKSIPKVHKIFGPGNRYVTEAKRQVAQNPRGAAIDMPAGPSEVLVIADSSANPKFVASDLLAQAEHDEYAKVILITISRDFAVKVEQEIESQLKFLSRSAIIKKSLKLSNIILVQNLSEAFNISNQYAPEHLILHLMDANNYIDQIINAGSIFIGEWSPESVGDYASGTNHVLPTYGYAKMYSGLDVSAFMKTISFQEFLPAGLKHLGKTVEILADLEGLDAHKNAVSVRLDSLENKF